MVLHFGNLVNSMCGDDMKQALYADSSYLLGSFNSYIGVGKNQEKKKLSAAIDELKPPKNEFAVKCADLTKNSGSRPSFFGNLFKKK